MYWVINFIVNFKIWCLTFQHKGEYQLLSVSCKRCPSKILNEFIYVVWITIKNIFYEIKHVERENVFNPFTEYVINNMSILLTFHIVLTSKCVSHNIAEANLSWETNHFTIRKSWYPVVRYSLCFYQEETLPVNKSTCHDVLIMKEKRCPGWKYVLKNYWQVSLTTRKLQIRVTWWLRTGKAFVCLWEISKEIRNGTRYWCNT